MAVERAAPIPRGRSFACGPLDIELTDPESSVPGIIEATLELYDLDWQPPRVRVTIAAERAESEEPLGPGGYMRCARMHVDPSSEGLHATCPTGCSGGYDARARHWTFRVPVREYDEWVRTDIESLLSLVLTTGWRELGYVPLHGGAVVRDGCCAILCAESGGGKTSLTAALLRNGWKTLGDDKQLIELDEHGRPEIHALLHTFNLHPRTREWFPEVGDLERLPVYSEWTDKRKVRIESIWPGSTIAHGAPTHLVRVRRSERRGAMRVAAMDRTEVLSTLLRQTVIPADAAVAQPIVSTLGATAASIRGLDLEIPEGVYADPDCLRVLEEALS